jgi:large subunit ribosomal protein L24
VRAQRGDLAVSGSVNLAEAAIDARLTLFGSGGAGAPAGTRPEIGIALKGPIDTPKRTIDVAALTSWLALRAVEQQSKKLDVLEGRAPVPPPVPAAVNATTAPKPKSVAPAAEGLQPLPPPIDIRPAPTPRAPRTPRPQQGAAATQGAPAQAQKPPPAPARPRSLSEILFGFGH